MKVYHLVIALFLVMPVPVVLGVRAYTNTLTTETITVNKTERVCSGKNDCKYMVFADEGTFQNTDNILFKKWNSSDIHGDINEGQSYRVETIGFRVPILSMHKNILSAQEVSE